MSRRRRLFPVALAWFSLAALVPAPRGAGEEELARTVRALEDAPDDVALLGEAARACASLGRSDEAVWYALLALDRAPQPAPGEGPGKGLGELVQSLSPDVVSYGALLEAYAESLFRVAQTCQRKKLWANAVDLLARCDGTRFESRSSEQLDKLFANEKAVEALLASGIDIPAQPVTKKSPDWIAKEDAKHLGWEKAYEIKGKYYTVITNMGYEMAHSIALAMEQMNSFYRRVFDYKERGGSMRRCVLKVYASRQGFDEHEGMKSQPSVRGFFRPSENNVSTYDPRTDPGGRPLSKLWSTLFHEASHQFITAATSGNLIPAWLDEGTASYFEGAELLPSGIVATNRIPSDRLSALLASIEQGSPTVKDVVSYFEPGSYDGEYYPFGWGLNYYIQNFENARSERLYLPIYAAYLESYTSGGQHDPLARFVEYFVKRAKVPGVDTFDAFVAHWQDWIKELGALYYGGPEKADVLLERARKQRANGKREYAVESYRWALDKRVDPRAQFELAEVLAELGELDGAVFGFRQALAEVRGRRDRETPVPGFDAPADEVARLCLERILALDGSVGEGLTEADATFVAATGELARKIAGGGHPRAALHLLQASRDVLGGDAALAVLADELGGTELDLRRWRRLPIDPGLSLWEGGADWKAGDGELRLDTKNLVALVHRQDAPEAYRYEARIVPGSAGEVPVYGLVFGANLQTGMRMFAALPKAGLVGVVALEEGPEITDRLCPMPEVGAEGLLFALEVARDSVRFFLGDKQVGEVAFQPRELRGRVGVFGQQTQAAFRELRLRY